MSTALHIPKATRELVYRRDYRSCARCGRFILGYGSIQHRKARGMGGTSDPRVNDPRNLILLCGSGTTGCHGWVESHPDQARTEGFRIDGYDQLDLPIVTRGRIITLTASGGRTTGRV